MSTESEQIRRLEGLVNRLSQRIAALEDPCGRMFVADLSNSGFTNRAMLEMNCKDDGSELQVLEDGRTVSGGTDAGVFLQIPGLKSGQAVMMGFALGDSTAYVRTTEQLRFGKVQTVGVCQSYSVVKECNSNGDLLSGTLVTVLPTKGGCDNVVNGFCLTIGDVIAYEPDPDDPTTGIQVGAHKSVSFGYKCTSGTGFASVPGLSSIRIYNGDFYLNADSDCGEGVEGFTNRANLYWRGFIVKGAYDGSICGATNTSSLGGVKVLDFTTGIGGASFVTNHARIQFDIICDDTTANQPTIGGSPCADDSGPKVAKIKGYFPVGTFIKSIDSATGVCNTNTGNIDITISVTTGSVVVPWP